MSSALKVGWVRAHPAREQANRVREMEQLNLRKKVDEFCFEGRLG
jgi:hypothetical protein